MKTQFWMSKWFVLICASTLLTLGVYGNLSYGVPGGICAVGDVLSPGQSCTDPGSGEVFSVSQDGRGHFLFITAGTGINLRAGNVNFSASKRGDGSWKINAVTPGGGGTTAPPPPVLPEPEVLVVVPDSPPIYWTDLGTNKIQRAILDGSNVQDLITSGLTSPNGFALDIAGGKMYWVDYGTKKIQRANLDGSNVQNLVTRGLEHPAYIALDVAGGKMYWTDLGTDKIQRANLDGSNVQDLITGLDIPVGLVLDIAGGKMYWVDAGTKKIQCANLDGSNVQDLVTNKGLVAPWGLALDIASGEMYWTDWGTEKIQRANLDGSNVQDLITRGLDSPGDIALDVAGGKMYWAHTDWNSATEEFTNGKIQRANLDGSDVENLITGLDIPDGIALGIPSQTALSTPDLAVAEDVNADDIVDVEDLVFVAQRYGQTGTNSADVNGDGIVNIDDLLLVTAVLDANAAAAPSLHSDALAQLTVADVKLWLSQARQRSLTDPSVRRGVLFLEQLLGALVPQETALLANYPNPFNPETWIPYQLETSAEVTLTIYAVDGQAVRQLELGHQAAGTYQTRSRAAHWDGRNEYGEPVASGLYFYTLTTGDFTATRKMLIRK